MFLNEERVEQRSDEWFALRNGRTTASKVSSILGELETKKGLPNKKTVGAIKTYAIEKVKELLFEREESFISNDMKRGIELEPLAFRKFSSIMNAEFMDTRESGFFTHGPDAGCSPDGLVLDLDGELHACLEIKCPGKSKYLELVTYGLEVIDSVYYDQMQMQMLCVGVDLCYFINYIINNGEEFIHVIEVKRDQERIGLIRERIKMVAEKRDEILKSYKQNNQN